MNNKAKVEKAQGRIHNYLLSEDQCRIVLLPFTRPVIDRSQRRDIIAGITDPFTYGIPNLPRITCFCEHWSLSVRKQCDHSEKSSLYVLASDENCVYYFGL